MVYLLIGLTGLLLLVALFTYISRTRHTEPEVIRMPEEGCCGAHAICEKGLKKIETPAEYFEDEELDLFKNIPSDAYSDKQIDQFREVLYTLRQEEISDWLVSLEKRELEFPELLKPELLDLLNNRD